MTQKVRTTGEKQVAGRQPTGKKPYQQPSFQYERVFETMALACGKIGATQKHCQFRRMSS
ncbi:MAG TPA: hypothetical protein VGZ28_16735 [Terriglobales bacterium]|jgi:hypothetical protein|nr:hypothetical protein [Terriglobales bacterium]